MSNRNSKKQRIERIREQSTGQRPSYRMRELEVTHGEQHAVLRVVVDDRPTWLRDDVVDAEILSAETADELDRLHESERSRNELIRAVIELEEERDKALQTLGRAQARIAQQERESDRALERARLRIVQQDRQLAEARERDQANVTRWRDAEARLEEIGKRARQLQQRLDAEPQPFLTANAQLRSENAELTARLADWETHKCAHREQQQRIQGLQRRVHELEDDLRRVQAQAQERITELEATEARLQVYENTVDGLGKGEHGELITRIQGLEAQLAEANRTIARLAPF